ncbi:hypothetical protein EWB00_003615 [Schistosoma japonicum]|uniref:Uncharacterized protein n=1 Tax=Schistosoma japonicum TaxID=6182 RepID=A0A4Z2D8V0_SCHJA|nr:hypothetical protein EWB00_003615 [Schistosoma japonicum]
MLMALCKDLWCISQSSQTGDPERQNNIGLMSFYMNLLSSVFTDGKALGVIYLITVVNALKTHHPTNEYTIALEVTSLK